MFVGWIKPDHIVPGGQAIFDVVEALGFREFVVALAKFGTWQFSSLSRCAQSSFSYNQCTKLSDHWAGIVSD
jgi:hypothetical protein